MTAIDFDLSCIRCGQSLLGLSLGGSCAGCGLTAGDSLKAGVLDPVTAAVSIDVACLGCGYNLKTLALSGVCPECATPVHRSLLAEDLRFADPRWLKNVRRGLTSTAVFFAFELALMTLLPLLAIAGGFILPLVFATSTVRRIAGIGLPILWCMSLLFISSAHPPCTHGSRGHRLRFWIRLLGISALVVMLARTAYSPAVNWFVGGATTATGGIAYDSWPRSFTLLKQCLFVPLAVCAQQIGALLLALYLRSTMVGASRSVRMLLVALAIASGLYAASLLASLPVNYVYFESIPVGRGAGPSGTLQALRLIALGVTFLFGLGFGSLGLAAALRTRRVVTQAMGRHA